MNEGQQGWRQMLNALASNVVQRLQPENARTTYESMERFIPPELRGLIPSMPEKFQSPEQTALLGAQTFGPQADLSAGLTSWNNAVRGLLASEQPLSKRLQDFGVGSAYTAAAIPMMGLPDTITWHGSPHKWAAERGYPHGRPRLDKMGTGEGAQVRGKGHYSGQAKGTAKSYRQELGTRIEIDGKPFFAGGKRIGTTGDLEADDYLMANLGDVDRAIKSARTSFAGDAAKILQDLKPNIKTLESGHLYKYDIPDADTAKYLDYHAPLDAQPQVVKDALKKEGLWHDGDTDRIAGGDIFVRMRDSERHYPRSPGAEETLRKHGVPGLRFKDQLSRGKKEGITYNYVTWDQDVLNRTKILEIDDVPVDEELVNTLATSIKRQKR